MVGLGNVDSTSDASKPISTLTQTALDAKAPLASPAFTGTVTGMSKTMVGLGNVDNTSDANKPISALTQTALDAKASLTGPTFTGNVLVNDSTLLAGNVSTTVRNTGTDGLANVYVNTTSTAGGNEQGQMLVGQNVGLVIKTTANHPIRIQPNNQEAIVINSDKSVTFAGTVNGITKTMVGLSNVDNTSDANKPISTLTQTALNAKANSVDVYTKTQVDSLVSAGAG